MESEESAKLRFNKWASLEDHIVFGVLEALLWDKVQIRYVLSSGSSYPSLSNPDHKELILAAEKMAKVILESFMLPKRIESEGYRTYIGRTADELEKFLSQRTERMASDFDKIGENCFIAADRFLEIHISNRTYEERV